MKKKLGRAATWMVLACAWMAAASSEIVTYQSSLDGGFVDFEWFYVVP